MGIFQHFPYTNFHALNLDAMIQEIKSNGDRITSLEAAQNSVGTLAMGDRLLVNITYDEDNETFVCDTEYADIQAKLQSSPIGQEAILINYDGQTTSMRRTGSVFYFEFVESVQIPASGSTADYITVTFRHFTLNNLDELTATKSSVFLQISDGE